MDLARRRRNAEPKAGQKRAIAIWQYAVKQSTPHTRQQPWRIEVNFKGSDWQRLHELLSNDPLTPCNRETQQLLANSPIQDPHTPINGWHASSSCRLPAPMPTPTDTCFRHSRSADREVSVFTPRGCTESRHSVGGAPRHCLPARHTEAARHGVCGKQGAGRQKAAAPGGDYQPAARRRDNSEFGRRGDAAQTLECGGRLDVYMDEMRPQTPLLARVWRRIGV